MKLSAEVLLEIMSIIQTAILEEKDASEMLRGLELENDGTGNLVLAKTYKREQ